MRKCILFLFCFISCLGCAQQLSRQDSVRISDSLFVCGYNLYSNKEYDKALPVFEDLLGIDTLLYETEHYQRMIYTGMWLGNTLYKLGREKDAQENGYTYRYYKATPVDPRLMNEVDSLALIANKLKDGRAIDTENLSMDDMLALILDAQQKLQNDVIGKNEIISIYRKRGVLVNNLLPKRHIWAANNDYLLAKELTKDLRRFGYVTNPYQKYEELSLWYRTREERDSLYLSFLESVKLLYGENDGTYINYLTDSYFDLCDNQVNASDIGINNLKNSLRLCKLYFPSDTSYLARISTFLGEANRMYAEYEYEEKLQTVRGIDYLDVLGSALNHFVSADSAYSEVIRYADRWQGKVWAYKKKAECFFSLAGIASKLKSNDFNEKDCTYYLDRKLATSSEDAEYLDKVNGQIFLGYIAKYLEKADNDRTQEFNFLKIGIGYLKDAIDNYTNKEDSLFSEKEYIELWKSIAKKQSEAHLYAESVGSYQKLANVSKELRDYDTYVYAYREIIQQYEVMPNSSKNEKILKQIISNGEHFLSLIKNAAIKDSIKDKNFIYIYKRNEVINKLGTAYYNLGGLSNEKEYYQKALPYVKEYLDTCKVNHFWGNSNYHAARYAECLWQIGDKEESMKLAIQQQESVFKDYLSMFLFSHRKLREQIVDYDTSDFELFLSRAYQRKDYLGAGILAYNKELFTKGLLINSERLLIDFIHDHNDDSKLNELYGKLETAKIELAQREDGREPYENEVDSLESLLLLRCKEIGNYNEALQIQWSQVQDKLHSDEMAIEFAKTKVGNSDQYIALLLKKEYKEPLIIDLFRESDLRKLSKDQYYKKEDLTNLIWKPLYKELSNVKTVYFAPTGELYNIAIENLPYSTKGDLVSDKWEIFRLSSTREIISKKKDINTNLASVFGGIKYDAGKEFLIADSRKFYSNNRDVQWASLNVADSLNLRAGVSYLPATKKEVEDIYKTLKKSNISVSLLTDTLASEASFKDLSGRNTRLLHIATHGFYWTEKEVQYSKKLNFLQLNSLNVRYMEDKPLTRSGLLFSGANNALKGEKLPDNVDDGVLTAKEISLLDFRNLDLVVMSACQTGLGEITGDGVFGLQRGFKKAGANTLLMSLWKVDDIATQLLMTQFYKNLTSGMSKSGSLKHAQKYVREYEEEVEVKSDTRPSVSAHAKEQAQQKTTKEKTIKKVKKYQDPYYWAAFILLDAIN